jgi:hypothetical protein
MTDQKAENREKTRARKEQERERKERHHKKLISRKLDHEVKEVDQWNKQRLMFANRIDNQFKKGKLYISLSCHCHEVFCVICKLMVEGVSTHQLRWCPSCCIHLMNTK